MFTIKQGNTAYYAVTPKVNGSAYTLVSGDKVLFCVKTSTAEEAASVIEKTLTSSDYNASEQLVLTILTDDTKELDAGVYKCDFAIQFANGTFITFIEADDFIIKPSCSKAVSV